jgi:predicted nuclease of predicted toxin-antitoxin system
VRVLADTNIVAAAVRALRADGHDVDYIAERPEDPGDAAILAEALRTRRVLITKDFDIGALVYRDSCKHAGVVLVDDLGDVLAETELLRATLGSFASELLAGAFLRAGQDGMRVARS